MWRRKEKRLPNTDISDSGSRETVIRGAYQRRHAHVRSGLCLGGFSTPNLFKDPMGNAVWFEPADRMPEKATLLNKGAEVEARVDLMPRFFRDGKGYLRLRSLPVNVLKDEPLVVKLAFESLPHA